MSNPFCVQRVIDSPEQLIGRNLQLTDLSDFLGSKSSTMLIGPEGSGKSTLLRSFFNVDFRKQMAKKRVLIHVGEFPRRMGGGDVYGYFADAIRSAVKILMFCGEQETMDALLQALNSIQYDSKKSRFDQSLEMIIMYGFRMVFVLDNFENFTSSCDIQAEHHDLLCGMVNAYRLQLIVATNFDFNATSLPAGTQNSTLLSRLSTQKIKMTPFSQAQCRTLLDRTLAERHEDFRFTDAQVRVLWELSGGIPTLLNMAAGFAFDVLCNGAEENWEETVREKTLKEAILILKRWCKIMTPEQLALLADLSVENRRLTRDEAITAAALVDRGILVEKYIPRLGCDGFLFNCQLLEQFCRSPKWMQEAAQNNPLRKGEVPVQSQPAAPQAGSGASPASIHIHNMTVHYGDNFENHIERAVIAGKGFERLFHILDLGRDELGDRLRELYDAGEQEALPPARNVEEAAARISAMFIPEEVETETAESYAQEQKTLESRFREVRARVDPQGTLDDALLNSLSTKCRLYLQIAFVVDDALSALRDFKLGDLSAQMVMYGKVLEQNLRDNLYDLFHTEPTLRDVAVTEGGQTFENMFVRRTCIGNYEKMLRLQASYLETLCRGCEVGYSDQPVTWRWWNQLGLDVSSARTLRNFTDHAGTETDSQNLEKMRGLLFGKESILHRCIVGAALQQKLAKAPAVPEATPVVLEAVPMLAPAVPETVPVPADPADREPWMDWLGRTATMTNIEATNRGSIRGMLQGTDYGVSISPKHLAQRHCSAGQFLGRPVQVRIIRWDSNGQTFNAELI